MSTKNNKNILVLIIFIILLLILIITKNKNKGVVFFTISKETPLHQDLEYNNNIADFLEKSNNQIIPLDKSAKFINLSLVFLKYIHNQNPNVEEKLPLQILNNYRTKMIINLSYKLSDNKDFFDLELNGKAYKCSINEKYNKISEHKIYEVAEIFLDNITNCLFSYLTKEKSNFVFVGIDHGLSLFTIKSAKKLDKNAKIGLFVFDEHVDIYDLKNKENLINKANVFGKLLLEGYVDYVVFLGTSDTAKQIVHESVDENFTRREIFEKISVYSDTDLIKNDYKTIINHEIKKMKDIGITNVMVSVDLDVLPPKYTGFEYSILAPAIGRILSITSDYKGKVLAEYPDGFSQGLEAKEINDYLRSIKQLASKNSIKFGVGKETKILGDVQELLTKQDLNNTTTYAAAQIVTSFFG